MKDTLALDVAPIQEMKDLLNGERFVLLNPYRLLYWHEKQQQYVVAHISSKKKYTKEDYLELPEGAPYELINYQLVYMASPFDIHQRISLHLTLIFASYVIKNKLGEVRYAPLDVHFDEGNIYQPDLLFISNERKHILSKFVHGAPDFVVEIISEGTAKQDYGDKKAVYGQYNVLEYWIIDIDSQIVEVYHNQENILQLVQKATKTDTILCKAIEGLEVNVIEVFRS